MDGLSPLGLIGIAIAVILILLVVFILLRTALFPIKAKQAPPLTLPEVDGQSVAERIGLAVQYKTIAYSDQNKIDGLAFEGLHRLLYTLYPQVHEQLKREVVNDYSLLFTWEGKKPELDPVMFIAHQDVVPADEGEDSGWMHPPFSGELADGFVWGRGTLDIKCGVIGIMEAVTALLKGGYQPERTIYLGFGHDEEVSGIFGAKAIAKLLESRGVRLAFLLDEGGSVIQGFLPGVNKPVALIGISEKGYLSLKLSSKVTGGHSSMPPERTAIGLLALSVAALEANPFPARLEVVQFLMSYLGKEVSFSQRMAFANPWLFGDMLKSRLSRSKTTNATIRTTTAPTIFHAGATDNVLPAEAEAVVNFRLLPGDTLRDVYERVVKIVDDEKVEVKPLKSEMLESDYGWNPTPIADTESPQFERLFDLVKGAFPEAQVAPYLVVGATDARHYAHICRNAFRFVPVVVSREDLGGMHGINERLSFDNSGRMVGFYMACMQEMGSLEVGANATLPSETAEQPEYEPEEELTVKSME